MPSITERRILKVLSRVKKLAHEYRTLTGKPLGVTGEMAEYAAAKCISGLKLMPPRQSGFDAIRSRDKRSFQIKGRCLLPGCKPGQRLGSINIEKEFDAVLMVLLDENFDATEIYEADKAKVVEALNKPGSRARNQRRQLGVSKFKQIGRLIWPRTDPQTAERPRAMTDKQAVDSMTKPSPKFKLKPRDGEASGAFIQRVILSGAKIKDNEMAMIVVAHYAGRRTTRTDIAWNRWQLRKLGKLPPASRGLR